jgi:hypothetical protein
MTSLITLNAFAESRKLIERHRRVEKACKHPTAAALLDAGGATRFTGQLVPRSPNKSAGAHTPEKVAKKMVRAVMAAGNGDLPTRSVRYAGDEPYGACRAEATAEL